MRLMDFILRPLSDFAAPYIDDIIVFSRSSKEHEQHMHQVFSRLQKYGLTINPSKTHLGQHKIVFSRTRKLHQRTSLLYPKRYRQFLIIQSQSQLSSYVPFNYYHSCLKNLAEALAPLTQFLSKRFKGIRKVPWDKESEMAFENVKKLVCQATLLAYPVAGSKLILQTDASDLSDRGGSFASKRG